MWVMYGSYDYEGFVEFFASEKLANERAAELLDIESFTGWDDQEAVDAYQSRDFQALEIEHFDFDFSKAEWR